MGTLSSQDKWNYPVLSDVFPLNRNRSFQTAAAHTNGLSISMNQIEAFVPAYAFPAETIVCVRHLALPSAKVTIEQLLLIRAVVATRVGEVALFLP